MQVDNKIIEKIKQGGVGVLPTDTLYGLVGLALSKEAVERIYRLKKRSLEKPLIILISDIKDIKMFGVGHRTLSENVSGVLERFWPGKVSIALPCPDLKIVHLHTRNGTMGFRLPKPKWLQDLLKKTGPLVAPSANLEGEEPAKTIEQAKKYFGNNIDFYVDAGKLESKPSTLIRFEDNKVIVMRQGSKTIDCLHFQIK